MKKHSVLSLAIIALLVCTAAEAKYSGGAGEPNNPYQIADANDLLALGANTADYDKFFILTADVNLAGQVFMKAIIGSTAFAGTFDGNGHKITHFTNGGLFGVNHGSIKNLGLENFTVSGSAFVGGLVGYNGYSISNCYSTGAVSGTYDVGGLVGYNDGSISDCCSTGMVTGTSNVGGLVGYNYNSTGIIVSSFWDTQTSGWMTSAGGEGKTTAEMKKMSTFVEADWDFIEIWGIGENQTYPYLRFEPAGDLNHDKKVNFADLAILALHWLEGTEQ